VPFFEDVDIAQLTKGDDDDDKFLTIPIGEINSTSGNKRFYDEAWISELEKQVAERRPIGIMGHLKPEDMATAFPPEAIHWVGVQRVGEMLWGKGYVPPGEARERVRRYKATGKKLATSIFAEARGVWDSALNAYRMAADSLNLKQIDIGPADRVGIPSLATVPLITAEMQIPDEDTSMDKIQVIREMTPDDAPLLPKPVREAIMADVPTPKEVEIVAELRAALEADDKADLVSMIAEMKQAQAQQARTAINGRITELVNENIKVEPLRPFVTELVAARNPASLEDVQGIYQAVVEMDTVKTALSTYLENAMGPAQKTAVNGQAVEPINKWFTRKEGE
jgi:hypothetical protein